MLCQCTYSDHIINHAIETKTGEYINIGLTLYPDKSLKTYMITSVESYIYGKNNTSVVEAYEKLLPSITQRILKKETESSDKDIISALDKIISKSPVLNIPLKVYRGMYFEKGIPENIFRVNHIFESPTVIWSSLDEGYAKLFLNDTSKCYGKNIYETIYGMSNGKSVLMTLTVPPKYPYLENWICFDSMPIIKTSEILFKSGSKIYITSIEKKEQYTAIEGIFVI